ncbi:MAG: diaminopropionate ammonia-lyase [Ectothiorhodospiraceae bacterium]|nr:diaminopropionate ammonia-lyase [Ectothiorhodospiraceae bacterium]
MSESIQSTHGGACRGRPRIRVGQSGRDYNDARRRGQGRAPGGRSGDDPSRPVGSVEPHYNALLSPGPSGGPVPTEPPAAEPRLHRNPRGAARTPYPGWLRATLDEASAAAARAEIESWPGYAPTPLVRLPGLAARAGVASVAYKDEGGRFGLGSFKALGGAYAVLRHVSVEVGRRAGIAPPSAADLLSGRHRAITESLTVACATDGNHGRSVAWGAQIFGCRCVIYVHETVSPGREAAIARYGAEVVRNPGNYDEAVRRAARDAAANGWTVVSDTSWEGYADIPRDVMHGYCLMADEALRELASEPPPTHVLVQGGVGGVAAAACATTWWAYGADRPQIVVVEPERAACLFESARAGERVALTGDIETVMAGLSCGETSLLAWQVLVDGAEWFMTVSDDAAMAAMRLMADGVAGDPPVVAGESAVAGVAGLLAAAARPEMAQALGLGPDARVLLFGTEGDTDPELYARIVGRDAAAVRAGAKAA